MSDLESLSLNETRKWIEMTMKIKYTRLKPLVTEPMAEIIKVLKIPHDQSAIMITLSPIVRNQVEVAYYLQNRRPDINLKLKSLQTTQNPSKI